MKKIILFFCLFAAVSCNPPVPKENDYSSTTSDTTTTVAIPAITKESNWEYTSKLDEMDNSNQIFYAQTQSTNTLQFGFPYEGGSTFYLTVRKKGKENEIILTVSQGHFLTDTYNDKRIRLKADDEKPIYITCGGSSSGGANILFLYPTKKIISKLKTSKKITIEPEFYEYGYKPVNFDVEGFEWRH